MDIASNVANGFGNELLEKLPQKDRDRLDQHLRHTVLKRGQILYKEGEQVTYLYFPIGCLISLIAMTEDAQTLEVGIVGIKGMVGLPAILRTGLMPYRVIVQIPGDAWKIKANILRSEFAQGQRLQDILLRYTHTLLTQVTQAGVCHRFHKIGPRLSRWLLDCQYQTGKDAINLTHELLAMMLGTSRSLVTTTAFKLQQTGAITYRQGQVTILDRDKLESVSCECHQVIRDEFARNLEI